MADIKTAEWVTGVEDDDFGMGCLRILDQTRLPGEVVFRDLFTVDDVVEAIRSLRVRGAPAIGVASYAA